MLGFVWSHCTKVRILSTVLGVALLVGLVNLQPGAGTARGAARSLKLGMILAHTIVSRWKLDAAGFAEEAKRLGDEPFIVSSEGNPTLQTSQVENMITKRVDALVITPLDILTAATLFAKAHQAGIKTVDYNFVVPGISPSYIVMRDSRAYAREMARLALKMHPTGNYVIVGGDPGMSVAQDTTAGYHEVLDPEVRAGRIKIVSDKYNPGWSPQTAQSQVEEALIRTHNDIAAVLSANDGMAIGAMAALKAQGLLGKVFVSGVDCDLANVQAIAQGYQAVCAWNDFRQMGRFAALAADAAARGRPLKIHELVMRRNGRESASPVVPTIEMPNILVTQQNLCTWVKKYRWVTYDDAYKLVTKKPQCGG